MWATLGMVAMYTAQDTALRLAIVVFALPAFVLACLLGAVDGMVRRDLRKWGGGRESSFVYHHAKAMTYLTLGGGFSLYLAWPGGGFNPAYMVLAGTALVAWSLSLTLSSFKKYL
jgi:integrating conjugative element membrane protein (TIGR03747 family)